MAARNAHLKLLNRVLASACFAFWSAATQLRSNFSVSAFAEKSGPRVSREVSVSFVR